MTNNLNKIMSTTQNESGTCSFRTDLINAANNKLQNNTCELVATINGVNYYNDASANSIERTFQTLLSIDSNIVWIRTKKTY
jgi:hypothetical protein